MGDEALAKTPIERRHDLRSIDRQESSMRIGRTVPPAAAVIPAKALRSGFAGLFGGQRYLRNLALELAEYFVVSHVFLLCSGKAALTVALQALHSLSPRNEVVIPAYTCFSVPSAVIKAGLKVRLCDIDTRTFDFDIDNLKHILNADTLCVVPDHLFGIPSNMPRIIQLCKEKGIFVLEDTAQAMGGTLNGKKLGTIGDVGVYSFGRGKNITCGSGGAIVTNRADIAQAIVRYYSGLKDPSLWKNIAEFIQSVMLTIFIRPSLYWFPAGLSFLGLGTTVFYKDFAITKLSGMKAGLLRNWRMRLQQANQMRFSASLYFTRQLTLSAPQTSPVAYLRLPVLVRSPAARASLYAAAKNDGIGISLMYPAAVNEIGEIASQFANQSFPAAAYVAGRLVTIPTHELLSMNDKKKIYNMLADMPLSDESAARVSNQETPSVAVL
jgi:dTDP-4-amino-4,6-dideoxygalactose transaminase